MTEKDMNIDNPYFQEYIIARYLGYAFHQDGRIGGALQDGSLDEMLSSDPSNRYRSLTLIKAWETGYNMAVEGIHLMPPM